MMPPCEKELEKTRLCDFLPKSRRPTLAGFGQLAETGKRDTECLGQTALPPAFSRTASLTKLFTGLSRRAFSAATPATRRDASTPNTCSLEPTLTTLTIRFRKAVAFKRYRLANATPLQTARRATSSLPKDTAWTNRPFGQSRSDTALITHTVLVEAMDTPLAFEETGYDAIIVTITTPDSPLMFETKL